MMTRKDFERIAQVFRSNKPTTHELAIVAWEDLRYDMCIELKAINPRFDAARFKAASEKDG